MSSMDLMLKIVRQKAIDYNAELVSAGKPYFRETDLISYDDIVNQVVFIAIKKDFEHAQQKESKTPNAWALERTDEYNTFAENERKLLERERKKAQHYRDFIANIKREQGSQIPDELVDVNTDDPIQHRKGRKITENGIIELENLQKLGLLKAISSKRVTSAKKVSNAGLAELYYEYDKHLEDIDPDQYNPDEFIGASIERFELESHFLVDWVYYVAKYAEEHEKGFPDIERVKLFSALVPTRSEDGTIYGGTNRPLALRLDMIPHIFNATDTEWAEIRKNYILGWRIVASLCNTNIMIEDFDHRDISEINLIQELIDDVSDDDRAAFLVDCYNLWENEYTAWADKREVSGKKVHYMRKLFDQLIMDAPKPPASTYRT